jgi:hypothetical protein
MGAYLLLRWLSLSDETFMWRVSCVRCALLFVRCRRIALVVIAAAVVWVQPDAARIEMHLDARLRAPLGSEGGGCDVAVPVPKISQRHRRVAWRVVHIVASHEAKGWSFWHRGADLGVR